MAAERVRHRVGVTGYPLTHTVSPAFQQPAFDHYGISAAYRTYPVTAEDLPALIATLRKPEWLGLNVTIPHKEAVVALVDRCTATARTIGAVNTLFKDGESLIGDNTDAHGFLTALRSDGATDPAGARVLVLGAGGSGACRTRGACASPRTSHYSRQSASRTSRRPAGVACGGAKRAGMCRGRLG